MSADNIDWPAVVFDHKMMAHIDYVAGRRFPSIGLAEEASTYIIEHLSEDDWRRCKKFQGNAKPETYLRVVISRALEDFSHKKFGKPRPPTWLKNQGQVWVDAWKMVCLERHLIESVKKKLASAVHTVDDIASIISTIKGRMPWCGEVTMELPENSKADDNEYYVDQYGQTCSLEQMNEEQEQQSALLFLSCLLNGSQLPDTSEELEKRAGLQQFAHGLQQARDAMALTAEEKLLLQLVYLEGKKFREVAPLLGMPGHQPARVLKKILARMEQALDGVGLSTEHLKALFAEGRE